MKIPNQFSYKNLPPVVQITLKWILFVHLGYMGIILFLCLIFNFINPPFSSLMVYRTFFFGYKVQPVKFIPIKKIPLAMRQMTVAVEDDTFYQHQGIEPAAIVHAMEINKRMKRLVAGGSTITQQLSRTLFLIPKKWWIRKYMEMIAALEMDFVMSKSRILELYLNNVEWGKGIFGVQAASLHYYGITASSLDREQIIRLITILSSPVKYNPDNFMLLRPLNQRYAFLESLGQNPASANTNLAETNSAVLPEEAVLTPVTNSIQQVPVTVDPSNQTVNTLASSEDTPEEGAPGTE